ncbi:MAG: T9SS type A sorting domain-containing protein [Bacteroidia bacterium]
MRKYIYLIGLLLGSAFVFIFIQKKQAVPTLILQDSQAILESKEAPSEFLYLTQNYPDGPMDQRSARQMRLMAEAKRSSRSNLPGFDASWTLQGPGNIGGRINTVTVHPSNSDIRFVGTTNGGIWKTTDAGLNWRPVFDNLPNMSIADIIFDESRPDTMFAATGDPNIPGYVYLGEGLYRSVNGGDTWQYLGLKDAGVISKVWVNPNDANVLLAAVMGVPMQRSPDRGAYKSIDAGQTWTKVLFVSNEAGIIDLVQDPRDPNTLLAASWTRIRTARESIVEGSDAGIWVTNDAGDTWQQSTTGLPSGEMGRIGLTASMATPNTFFSVYVGPDRQLEGVYKTSDGATSWSRISTDSVRPGLLGGFGWYFGKIGVNPTDDNNIYILGVDLFSTTDGGQDWDYAAPPWFFYDVHADKHDIHFIGPDHILLATDGGLYETIDRGASWSDNENIPNTQFYRIAHNPHQPNLYYGGAQDNGSTGGDNTDINNWPRIFGGDGFQMRFDPNDPDTWWCMTQNGNINYTTDGGGFYSWQEFGIDQDERSNWDGPLLLSAHDPQVLYHARQRVYRASGGAGSTWDSISSILTNPDTTLLGSSRTISALEESPLDADILYAGTASGELWVSTDYGVNWTERSVNLPDRYITSIVASPTDRAVVYVTHSGFRYNEFFSHVHRSDDFGQTWVPISGDLPDVPVHKVYILPNANDSVIVAATSYGIYATADGGLRWETLGDMLAIPVFDLGENPAKDELVAGTFARGIQTYPLDSLRKAYQVIASRERKLPITRMSVSPNPTSGVIKIALSPEVLRQASLELTDVQGKFIRRLSSDDGGNVNIGSLASGMYIVNVSTKTARYSAKVIVE